MNVEFRAITNFRENLKSVETLMGFDGILLDVLGHSLRSLKARIEKHEITNRYLEPERLLTTVEQFRERQSLRPYYQAMYNQCLVLAVSHFASAVRDMFTDGIRLGARTLNARVTQEEIRITAGELMSSDVGPDILVAESIADRGDFSWQDMQSIGRAFAKYFGRAPDRDSVVNDIIVAQAVRHVIVHAGARADKRLLKQVQSASPRTLDITIVPDEVIQLSPNQVRIAGQSMTTYLDRLADVVREAAI